MAALDGSRNDFGVRFLAVLSKPGGNVAWGLALGEVNLERIFFARTRAKVEFVFFDYKTSECRQREVESGDLLAEEAEFLRKTFGGTRGHRPHGTAFSWRLSNVKLQVTRNKEQVESLRRV